MPSNELSRHELARMSRINRVRLFTCLVSILKVVSEAKFPLSLWGRYIIESLAPDSPLIRRYEQMRAHLVSAITYHLRQISSRCFPSSCTIEKCFTKSGDGLFATYSIFPRLEEEIERLRRDEFIDLHGGEKADSMPWNWYFLRIISSADTPTSTTMLQGTPLGTLRSFKVFDKDHGRQLEDIPSFAWFTLDNIERLVNAVIEETIGNY